MTKALRTDRYELTMLSSFVEEGIADRRAVFEAFTRRLPEGRTYGVAAGLERIVDAVEAFVFEPDDITWLVDQGAVTTRTADYLARFRFSGDIIGYREGEVYFPNSPVLTVEASLGEAIVLETILLSILNHDCAIAAAAARMVEAAEGRPLIEMGSRRTHEEAALATARAAYLCGFASTSNLAAGRRYQIPTVGTAAHAFTLAHHDELSAFRAQITAHGPSTTLLVDTFDIEQGVRNAVSAAGPSLGAIRIDSGDLGLETRRARTLLNELGATDARITASSDLDEYVLAALAGAPIDSYGVGTRVASGSGHPTAGLVYKLVAVGESADPEGPLRPVAKSSAGKVSVGGRKRAFRVLDDDGYACAEWLFLDGTYPPTQGRWLQVPVMLDGKPVSRPTLEDSRRFHARARSELRPSARNVAEGPPALIAQAALTRVQPRRIGLPDGSPQAVYLVDRVGQR